MRAELSLMGFLEKIHCSLLTQSEFLEKNQTSEKKVRILRLKY